LTAWAAVYVPGLDGSSEPRRVAFKTFGLTDDEDRVILQNVIKKQEYGECQTHSSMRVSP